MPDQLQDPKTATVAQAKADTKLNAESPKTATPEETAAEPLAGQPSGAADTSPEALALANRQASLSPRDIDKLTVPTPHEPAEQVDN